MSEDRRRARDERTLQTLFDAAFVQRLEGLRLRARRLSGAQGAGRPGRQLTPAADFIDHRAYSPGDDLRHIDWPAMARHDQVHVKIGRMPRATRVHLLLDTSASMAAVPEKRTLSRQLAAALGWLSLAAGDRVTLRPFPAVSGGWGPASGPGVSAALLAALSSLPDSTTSETRFDSAVAATARDGAAGGLAVVISDLWLDDDLEAALGRLPAPRWEVIVLHVLSRAELHPQPLGPVELVDSETGASMVVAVDGAMIDAYRQALHARLERLRRAVGRRGATYALIPADWPLERAVVPYLRRRAILAQ
jgi:uncharacterized protein (DUF58 family)